LQAGLQAGLQPASAAAGAAATRPPATSIIAMVLVLRDFDIPFLVSERGEAWMGAVPAG
jgi:hypothetical protein